MTQADVGTSETAAVVSFDHLSVAPKGLGGWLLLVGFGLVLAPVKLAIDSWVTFAPIFTDPAYLDQMDPSSASFSAWLKPYLYGEIAINIILLLASLLLIFGFFGRKPWFPRVFILITLAAIALTLLDAWIGLQIFPQLTAGDVFDPTYVKELVRAVVNAAIWIPYMLLSQRVKNTFVQS